MIILKTLWNSIRAIFRKEKIWKKTFFALCLANLFIASRFFLIHFEYNEVLSFCVQWSWIPSSVILLVIMYGEVLTRHRLKRLFISEGFVDNKEKTPDYIKTTKSNAYLEKVCFKSKIHPNNWEKFKDTLEMFYEKKIYRLKENPEDITKMDVLLIDEQLPRYIEWNDAFLLDECKFVIGEGFEEKSVWDASVLHHGIISGSTSSGKTALLRVILHQAILKQNYIVHVLDFKGGSDYASIEKEYIKHNNLKNEFGGKVISEPEEARNLLTSLKLEVEERMASFKRAGVTNIKEYNSGSLQKKYILLVIDEAAEILDVKPKNSEDKLLYSDIDQTLRTLARTARAAGINIIFGLIRPDSNVIDGQIKNNLLWRVCGYFKDPAASGIVLDNDLATTLPPEIKGRFIVGEDEVQAYYLPIPKHNGACDDGEP